MARPRLRCMQLTIKLSRDEAERIAQAAREQRRTVGETARLALFDGLAAAAGTTAAAAR
jgi:hypothetical protein